MIYGLAANIKVIDFESELEVGLTLHIVSDNSTFIVLSLLASLCFHKQINDVLDINSIRNLTTFQFV
ncbi:hypothetical protein JCM19296_736 [Nonlabens ulvanivorans]|uniref:Uncharacterized protein n=1 Tax=Nonlabens ulvanivorans TaxID=906888 RepID=A0A081D8B2_NONUL|nr:hypothetical protein JCM19296_736 [Nonlabens ulvanivorans]